MSLKTIPDITVQDIFAEVEFYPHLFCRYIGATGDGHAKTLIRQHLRLTSLAGDHQVTKMQDFLVLDI